MPSDQNSMQSPTASSWYFTVNLLNLNDIEIYNIFAWLTIHVEEPVTAMNRNWQPVNKHNSQIASKFNLQPK